MCSAARVPRTFRIPQIDTGFLLVPYLGWLRFATVLNVAMWQMSFELSQSRLQRIKIPADAKGRFRTDQWHR